MKSKLSVKHITLIALGITLNIIGAFTAMLLRFPIYMDSIGTIMISSILGAKYGVMTGICGSLISGMTFDVYSLYFAPVQISTGLFSALMFSKGYLKGRKTPLGVLVFALPTSVISSIITAYIFGGITSSGSSYIVQIFKVLGFGDVYSVFITQFFTDYIDKFIGVVLVNMAINAIPKSMKLSMTSHKRGDNYNG